MAFRAIYQIVPTLTEGDAVSDYALLLRDIWRSWGIEALVFAATSTVRGEGIEPLARLPRRFAKGCALLYHHSTGSEAADAFLASTGAARLLIYHNITPPRLLSSLPSSAARSHWGLQQLRDLAARTQAAFADSDFNRQDLVQAGFGNCFTLPLAVSESRQKRLSQLYSQRPSPCPDSPQFLHVGRLFPHKRLEDVLRVFALYQSVNAPGAHLTIVGNTSETPEYLEMLRALLAQHHVRNVHFTGKVSEEELMEHYRNSDIYLCMSRHEGFCMPLAECMFAGVPLLCYAAAAVPETVGKCAFVIEDTDPAVFAEAAHMILHTPELRAKLVSSQRRRAEFFTRPQLEERLRHLFAQF